MFVLPSRRVREQIKGFSLGVVVQEGLKLLTHLHAWLTIAHKITEEVKEIKTDICCLGKKQMASGDACKDRVHEIMKRSGETMC